MKVALIESSPAPQKINRLDEFEIGSIGIIREWNSDASPFNFNGVIVKRETSETLRRLENIIDGTLACFTESYSDHMAKSNSLYYIETLPEGTKLEITL